MHVASHPSKPSLYFCGGALTTCFVPQSEAVASVAEAPSGSSQDTRTTELEAKLAAAMSTIDAMASGQHQQWSDNTWWNQSWWSSSTWNSEQTWDEPATKWSKVETSGEEVSWQTKDPEVLTALFGVPVRTDGEVAHMEDPDPTVETRDWNILTEQEAKEEEVLMPVLQSPNNTPPHSLLDSESEGEQERIAKDNSSSDSDSDDEDATFPRVWAMPIPETLANMVVEHMDEMSEAKANQSKDIRLGKQWADKWAPGYQRGEQSPSQANIWVQEAKNYWNKSYEENPEGTQAVLSQAWQQDWTSRKNAKKARAEKLSKPAASQQKAEVSDEEPLWFGKSATEMESASSKEGHPQNCTMEDNKGVPVAEGEAKGQAGLGSSSLTVPFGSPVRDSDSEASSAPGAALVPEAGWHTKDGVVNFEEYGAKQKLAETTRIVRALTCATGH